MPTVLRCGPFPIPKGLCQYEQGAHPPLKWFPKLTSRVFVFFFIKIAMILRRKRPRRNPSSLRDLGKQHLSHGIFEKIGKWMSSSVKGGTIMGKRPQS